MNSRELVTFELKALGKSSMFLALTVIQTCVFGLGALSTILNTLFMQSYSTYGITISGTPMATVIFTIIVLAIQALPLVGLWLIFVASRNSDKYTFKTAGLTVYKVSTVIRFVLIIIAGALLVVCGILIVACFDLFGADLIEEFSNQISGQFSGLIGDPELESVMYGSSYSGMIITAIFQGLGVGLIIAGAALLLLGIFYFLKLLKTLKMMKLSAVEGMPYPYCSTFLIVMLWIAFIVMLIGAIGTFVTGDIAGGITAVLTAIGLMLEIRILQHFKGAMMNVQNYLNVNNASNNTTAM